MNADGIVIDTHPIGLTGDTEWETRFEFLLQELWDEYGPHFHIADNGQVPVDFLFILYPTVHHSWIVNERIIESIIFQNASRLTAVHLIACGKNSKHAKVSILDVEELVNSQCVPSGLKTGSIRAMRPEEIDTGVRDILVRKYGRRKFSTSADSATDRISYDDQGLDGITRHPLYDRGDL